MLYKVDDLQVQFKTDSYYIASNASVIGNVMVGDNVSVWFNAVIRADSDLITIGDNTNIQDAAVLHTDPGFVLRLGTGVTVGHKAMLHGCEVGDNSLIGINAVVLNGAKIGRNCLIGANALIPERMEIPDGSLVVGSPGRVRRQLTEEEMIKVKRAAKHYVASIERYRSGLVEQ